MNPTPKHAANPAHKHARHPSQPDSVFEDPVTASGNTLVVVFYLVCFLAVCMLCLLGTLSRLLG